MTADELEIEIDLGNGGPQAPEARAVRRAAQAALAAASVQRGHLAITFVDRARIGALNRAHRGHDSATDVLSFPLDARNGVAGPRELGDVVICADLCDDPIEAVVHGVLHLAGHDHETDAGEMLALQERVVARLR